MYVGVPCAISMMIIYHAQTCMNTHTRAHTHTNTHTNTHIQSFRVPAVAAHVNRLVIKLNNGIDCAREGLQYFPKPAVIR